MTQAGSPSPVLETRRLHRYLGSGAARIHVLRGLDLQLQGGRTYAVVGPSGCGKSTLLYLLGLLDRPDEGRIFLRGQPVESAPEQERTRIRARQIGFVFQFHFLLAEFSALENLILPMVRSGLYNEADAREQGLRWLDRLGMAEKADRRGNQLSGGERQRVAVARALVNNPDLVLADEPTGNLDFHNSQQLFARLRELAREGDRAVLIVTHNRDLAEACDVVLPMKDGLFESIPPPNLSP